MGSAAPYFLVLEMGPTLMVAPVVRFLYPEEVLPERTWEAAPETAEISFFLAGLPLTELVESYLW